MRKLRLGTRGSVLALWQAEYIKAQLQSKYHDIDIELVIVKTKGDKILNAPLAAIGGKGLFTKELEEMILCNHIDIAVHSLKDVPVDMLDGLKIAAFSKRDDVRDAFLSDKYPNLESLPHGARVGTTSLRRTMQLKNIRCDLDTQSLRGNVQTRLKKLKNGDFDAIILAMAGVNRLDLYQHVKYIMPLDSSIMIPAMGQAALAVQCKNNCSLLEFLAVLNDEHTACEVLCERAFMRVLGGGCQVPIGVNAVLKGAMLEVSAVVGVCDGSLMLRKSLVGKKAEYEKTGVLLAEEMIACGAKEILQKAQMINLSTLL